MLANFQILGWNAREVSNIGNACVLLKYVGRNARDISKSKAECPRKFKYLGGNEGRITTTIQINKVKCTRVVQICRAKCPRKLKF